MAGHSKWANIKHRKQAEDLRRGKIFSKISRMITLAAREGGGDPDGNFRLRLAIEKAKAVNMPSENIQRAIKRGIGEIEGAQYEEMIYEGYAPGGVAVLLEVLTDNRNRTAGELRHLFSKHGGSLGEAGCVAWMFQKKGIITLDRARLTLDEDSLLELALEAGAEDVEWEDEHVRIVCSPDQFQAVQEAVAARNLPIVDAEVTMRASSEVKLEPEDAKKVLRLLEVLDDHDDVQAVHTNADIPDEVLESA